jgi:hypothetical protein
VSGDGRDTTGRDRLEHAALIARTAEELAARLDEVRLPLHILLSDHYGELNENQEEMLGAAQTAATEAAVVVARLRALIAGEAGDGVAPPDASPSR